jgi:hypothetical protein
MFYLLARTPPVYVVCADALFCRQPENPNEFVDAKRLQFITRKSTVTSMLAAMIVHGIMSIGRNTEVARASSATLLRDFLNSAKVGTPSCPTFALQWCGQQLLIRQERIIGIQQSSIATAPWWHAFEIWWCGVMNGTEDYAIFHECLLQNPVEHFAIYQAWFLFDRLSTVQICQAQFGLWFVPYFLFSYAS